MEIKIRSFHGIGDLLFCTPALPKIKQEYPEAKIIINTNYPELLKDNPYVDVVNDGTREGVYLNYPDPVKRKDPTKHHIESDWEVISKHYNLKTMAPELKPEIYFLKEEELVKNGTIGVQTMHKGQWHGKKVWPYFEKFIEYANLNDKNSPYNELGLFEAIPKFPNIKKLVEYIASCRAVVCAEGGISHIAKAVDTPAIVIYGGFAKPMWNGYLDQINITYPMQCSYCYNPGPCLSLTEKECMKAISIKQVFKAVQGIQKIPMLEQHNAMTFVKDHAYRIFSAMKNPYGLDIGAGKNPLPGTRPIDNGFEENACNIKEANASVNFIFSSHCLEHLESPATALTEWWRVLKRGGLLYLYLPHPDYIPWRKESMPKWHKHNFYPDSVKKLLELHDFKLLYCKEKDEYFGQIYLAKKI